MLGAGTLAQAASTVMNTGPAFLIPSLVSDEGLTLAEAGLVAGAPVAGGACTLVAWGLLCDRRGERLTLLAGLVATAVLGVAAAYAGGPALLALALFLAGRGLDEHQRGERPGRDRVVPTAPPRAGDGHPADLDTGGRRASRPRPWR